MFFQALVIFFVTLAGGCVPLVIGIRERLQRGLLAVATGVLLGAVFLHMLPELSKMQSALEGEGHAASLWMIVLAVVVVLGFADAILCRREGDPHGHEDEHAHHHLTVGWAAFVGLSIHSFSEGIGLAAAAQNAQLSSTMYASILAHKAAESFSLSTIFALGQFKKRRIFLVQVGYALVTPLGILLGNAIAHSHQIAVYGLGVLTAVACGTFLFVGLCELLPGAFHRRERAFFHLVLVAAGVGFMLWCAGD